MFNYELLLYTYMIYFQIYFVLNSSISWTNFIAHFLLIFKYSLNLCRLLTHVQSSISQI